MKLYILCDDGSQYHIDDQGNILRLDLKGFTASGHWKMLGLHHDRRNEAICLSKLRRIVGGSTVMPESWPYPLRYKNGKGQWRIVDNDHGTKRVWGRRVTDISVIERSKTCRFLK